MEKSQLKQIIREMLLQEAEVAPQQNDKIQGQIKIELFTIFCFLRKKNESQVPNTCGWKHSIWPNSSAAR